jgi:hypothetical protein
MIIRGEGGIGKSIVVHTVSEYFRHRGAAHLLLRIAYTGVAASLIDGNTCHSTAMIPRRHAAVDNEVGEKLQQAWRNINYHMTNSRQRTVLCSFQ